MTLNATAEFEAILDAAISAVRVDHVVKLDAALAEAVRQVDELPVETSAPIWDALYRSGLSRRRRLLLSCRLR